MSVHSRSPTPPNPTNNSSTSSTTISCCKCRKEGCRKNPPPPKRRTPLLHFSWSSLPRDGCSALQKSWRSRTCRGKTQNVSGWAGVGREGEETGGSRGESPTRKSSRKRAETLAKQPTTANPTLTPKTNAFRRNPAKHKKHQDIFFFFKRNRRGPSLTPLEHQNPSLH